MRAWTIADSFGIDHLRLIDRPDPEPTFGQVVVAVKAVSLNYRELLMGRGFRELLLAIECVARSCKNG